MFIVLGYLIGARRLNDIQKRVNATLKVAIAACVGMAVLMCLGGKYIFLIFTDNPEIIALGRRILVIEIVLEIGRAVNIVMTKCLIAFPAVFFHPVSFIFSHTFFLRLSSTPLPTLLPSSRP